MEWWRIGVMEPQLELTTKRTKNTKRSDQLISELRAFPVLRGEFSYSELGGLLVLLHPSAFILHPFYALALLATLPG
jgi:hypothetical protein